MSRAALVLAVLAAVAGAVAMTARPVSATTWPTVRLSAYDASLLAHINHARVAHHLVPLRAVPGTTGVAHRWSCAMGSSRTLAHRPNLVPAVAAAGAPAWRILGENVGKSTSVDPRVLFSAYMHSPKHRANILEPRYRFIGISTTAVGSARWNTMDFVDRYNPAYVRSAGC
jgi:uncharacterized protein YkwD